MHWKIGQFPELNHLAPRQREMVLSRVPWWTYPLMLARSIVGAFFISLLASVCFTLSGVSPVQRLIASAVVMTLATVGLYLNEVSRIHNSMRNELVRRFKGKRPPFCLACGYDLRASGGTWCPECGGKLG